MKIIKGTHNGNEFSLVSLYSLTATKRPIGRDRSATPGAFTKITTTKSIVHAGFFFGFHSNSCEAYTAFPFLILKAPGFILGFSHR
jgi:hypothetical protein